MNYVQRKATASIRESIFKGIELMGKHLFYVKRTGNPYASIETRQDLIDEINKLSKETFERILQLSKGGDNELF